MAAAEDIKLAVEKLTAVMAQGDRCSGMLWNRPAAEWKDIFNAAAAELKIPLVELGPLKSGNQVDVLAHITSIGAAFAKSAGAAMIILMDSSGDRNVNTPEAGMALGNQIEAMTEQYPHAIYIQMLPQDMGRCATSVNLYCMNPKVPNTTGRFDPV